ncbi:hypothetical protein RD792_004326 [Penstemon davidsonii]|uniref:Glycosyltransferase n=1 Tax=Penstemon davidsonii TaxID=160366 RepID=A0ABR0DI98_9LAMI|nr:hypothetical protein RD792_004326 [Penstemon davidsonii]
MDYSKKSPIATLSLFLLTLILILFSWNPLTYKLTSFPQKHSSNTTILISVPKDELQIALDKASLPNKTLIIAIINKAYVEPHENEYPTMFDLFLEGFWAGEETRPLVNNLLVVAMDETAYQRCLFRRLNCYRLVADGGDEFSGEKIYMSGEFIEMMWRRTLFLLDVLKRGYNFIFTDTDVLWLRNPFKRLINNETIDFELSTDVFNGNSSSKDNLINTGFYFIKSNNKTISLFETWYDKRKNSTGMKEQDVLANLVLKGVFGQLGLKTSFLDTIYFSGFCSDSKDVRLVATVHANCCRTIRAKVEDLKTVLRDWKRFKNRERTSTVDGTNRFRWSRHVSCIKSWHNETLH